MEKIKRRLGLVISIDLARREIRYEREHAMRSVDNERKEQKYPETLNFDEKGSGFVLMAKEIRPGIETKFGERTAVECIERVSKKRVTVWWPKGIPVPSLQLPCMLVRLDKKTWKLVTCDTREEGLQLWKTGEISNPAPASADSEEFA
jgi:hypothetical protein